VLQVSKGSRKFEDLNLPIFVNTYNVIFVNQYARVWNI